MSNLPSRRDFQGEMERYVDQLRESKGGGEPMAEPKNRTHYVASLLASQTNLPFKETEDGKVSATLTVPEAEKYLGGTLESLLDDDKPPGAP